MVGSILQLCVALPAGIFADKISRDRVLKVSSVIGLVSVCVFVAALVWPSIGLIYATLSVTGVCQGALGPAAEAIFSDSLETGPMRNLVFALHEQSDLLLRLCSLLLLEILGRFHNVKLCCLLELDCLFHLTSLHFSLMIKKALGKKVNFSSSQHSFLINTFSQSEAITAIDVSEKPKEKEKEKEIEEEREREERKKMFNVLFRKNKRRKSSSMASHTQ